MSKQKDAWKKLISGAFGSQDKIFAMHPCEIKRASKMLAKAIADGVGYKEYTSAIKSWLKETMPSNKNHIQAQMKRVRKLSTYFQAD